MAIFQQPRLLPHPTIAIVLHGDLLPPGRDSYHYVLARVLAERDSGVIGVGLIRPGYTDEAGDRSDGDAKDRTGDNYTTEVVNAVAQVAGALRRQFRAGRIVLIGHSGGAAISALTLERHPQAAEAAVLVSCPCDLGAWRQHMKQQQGGNRIWDRPHRALSPIERVQSIRSDTRLLVLVGEEDDVAVPEYSRAFALKARTIGASVQLQVLPGLGHEILLDPAVGRQIDQFVRTLANP